jgi:hypothetical protein
MSRSLPGYITRDLSVEARRSQSQQHVTASRSAAEVSASDATAGLVYARSVRNRRFDAEQKERRRKNGISENGLAIRTTNSGVPLGSRGKAVYELARAQVGDMARFGKDVEHRAIVERLIQMGAKA